MAVVEEEPGGTSGAFATLIAVLAFLVIVVVLFIGLAGLHWFGFNQPASVGTAPSVTPTPTPSASASAAASPSAS